MNEYQTQVKQTIELLFAAAQKANGRVLDAGSVRRVCSYIQSLHSGIEQLQTALQGADALLGSYINEYGNELMDTLVAEAQAEVVEGEVIDDEETYTLGQAGQDDGVDPSEEE